MCTDNSTRKYLPPAIETPQLGIMSANLTVNHANICAATSQFGLNSLGAPDSDVCQY